MNIGYSNRSLVEKLGIQPGWEISVLNPPVGYLDQTLAPLPDEVRVTTELTSALPFIQFFSKERRELQAEFPKLKDHLLPTGTLWISWPKGSSKVPTDLDENGIRRLGLVLGLVDIKVCAVDDVWSGLKFVTRKENRI